MTSNTKLCRYTSGALQMAFWDLQKGDSEFDKVKLSQSHVKSTRVGRTKKRETGEETVK